MSEENPPLPSCPIKRNHGTGKVKLESNAYSLFCWILTFCIWIIIILLIKYSKSKPLITEDTFYKYFVYYEKIPKIKISLVILLLIIYIIYFSVEVNSIIFKCLYQKSKETFIEKMKNIFCELKPEFILKYRKSSIFSCNNKYQENSKFFRYHWRDTSGLFEIDTDKKYVTKKYIFLYLKQEINFADIHSILEYNHEKENFIKDKLISSYEIREEIKIKNFQKHFVLKFKNNEGEIDFVNYFVFLLFTFLSLAELFKIYINFVSVCKVFTIRKLVSTKKENLGEEYDKLNPLLKLNEEIEILEDKNFPKLSEINIDDEESEDKETDYQINKGRNNKINNNPYKGSIQSFKGENKIFTND